MDPAWIALIGTVVGGVGLKLIESWLSRSKVKRDDAALIRDELRLTISGQREENRELEKEVDKWRNDYYNLRDKYVKLQTDLTLALAKIKQDKKEGR